MRICPLIPPGTHVASRDPVIKESHMSHETVPPPPKGKPMSWWEILKFSFSEWSEDRASRLAAAVAYYAIFSIVPLLMIAISITGLIYGTKAANDQIRPQLAQSLV